LKRILTLISLLAVLIVPAGVGGQSNLPDARSAQGQATQGLYYLTPISNTAAVNNQVTLTIPAPPTGLYNYIC